MPDLFKFKTRLCHLYQKKDFLLIVFFLGSFVISLNPLFSINQKILSFYFLALFWSVFLIFKYWKSHITITLFSIFYFLICLLADSLTYKVDFIHASESIGIFPFGGFFISGDLVFYIFFCLGFWFLLAFLCQKTGNKYLKVFKYAGIGLLVFLALLVPCVYLFYYLIFGTYITPDIFHLFFYTNYEESCEFLSRFSFLKYFVFFILINFVVLFFLIKNERKERESINPVFFMILFPVFSILLYFNKENFRLVYNVWLAVSEYERELDLFSKINKKRETFKSGFETNISLNQEGAGGTYLVVIGESLARKHLGIYGYSRDTSPRLSKQKDLLLFTQAYSNNILTVKALSLALTEANQYNGKSYYQTLSIINILKRAGFETFWLTNQSLYGVFGRPVTVIGKEAHHVTVLNKNFDAGYFEHDLFGGPSLDKAQKFDGVLVKEVEKILSKKTNKKNRVIFVHLMGNHFDYCLRYPRKFSYFDKGRDNNKRSFECEDMGFLDCYDNSVRYNDFVVNGLLEALKKQAGKKGFFYFSDHGEDVCGAGEKRSLQFLNKNMLNIPFLAWFSEEYRNSYPERYGILKNNRDRIFSNDLIFDTLVGLFGIKTERYNKAFDLSSKDYSLTKNTALVIEGKLKYTEVPDNLKKAD